MLSRATFGLELTRRYLVSNRTVKRKKEDAVWLSRELSARGPVLIKIGQFISSRGDIFDPVLVETLKSLQDHVPPMQEADLVRIMDSHENDRVASYDLEPVASASIGQVHKGVLQCGSVVAIKVRRPQIKESIVQEIQAFGSVLGVFEIAAHVLNDGDAIRSLLAARRLLTDFQEVMLIECDYLNEAKNMSMYHALDHADLQRDWVSPKVFTELCSDNRIVMEYIPSVRIDAIVPHLAHDDRQALAIQVMDLFTSHMLVHNVVHSDFQPGNVGIDTRGRFVLYDFGNIICLPSTLVQSLEELLFPLMNRDVDTIMAVLQRVDVLKIRDEVALRRYIELFVQYLWSVDLSSLDLSVLDVDSLRSNKLPVEIDGVVFRMLRGFTLVEGLCKSIDRGFTYSSTVEKYAMQLAQKDDRFYWIKAKTDVKHLLAVMARLLEEL